MSNNRIAEINSRIVVLNDEEQQALYSLKLALEKREYGQLTKHSLKLEEIEIELEALKLELKDINDQLFISSLEDS